MKTLKEMRELYQSNGLEMLTVERVNSLKGKKIQTIYFGYDHQDGIDEFVVGDIVPERDMLTLLRADGTNTFIRCTDGEKFWCSDEDRYVYYLEVK